jgi:hypothetical protein
MADKYCPAGKCECERYHRGSYNGDIFCSTVNLTETNRDKECPWPSKQQVAAEIATMPRNEKIKKDFFRALGSLYIAVEESIADDVCNIVHAYVKQIYLDGKNAGIDAAIGAVKKTACAKGSCQFVDEVLDAISALKVKT